MIIAGIIVLVISVFLLLTRAVVYENKPYPKIYNTDASNSKQRPFIVDKEEYPFKSNWFKKDGLSMHYVDEGEGIPVVLCHGNPEWSFIYRNLIKELSGECRLIAYDLPGYGFSELPTNWNYTPQEYVEWINELVIDHLKLDKFILVVQDWGGPTGLTMATNNPDRLLGAVIGNSWAWKATGGLATFSYVMRTFIMKRLVLNKNYLAGKAMPAFLNEASKNNKAITDAFAMPFPTVKSRKCTLVMARNITKASPFLEQLESHLHRLSDKPIELIFGQKDSTLGSETVKQKWLSHFPHATVQLAPEANHFSQEDSPEKYILAVRRILKEVKAKN